METTRPAPVCMWHDWRVKRHPRQTAPSLGTRESLHSAQLIVLLKDLSAHPTHLPNLQDRARRGSPSADEENSSEAEVLSRVQWIHQ